MSDPPNNPTLLYDDGFTRSSRHDEWTNLVGRTVPTNYLSNS
ncbi:hypothetical protein [Paenarthrobacter ureafaciens]|nr:hypothetical protein [Paenarthrobacter ureafaciens]MCX8453634.1 hypothetical protein [Paenarthrobacter ureafaciens]MCY0973293.1 hypothetical protein [Paenarthrobacter ureafaciens]